MFSCGSSQSPPSYVHWSAPITGGAALCWETGDFVCECEKRNRKEGGKGEGGKGEGGARGECAELSVFSFLGCRLPQLPRS